MPDLEVERAGGLGTLYLSPDSLMLEPHLDSIAMLELMEPVLSNDPTSDFRPAAKSSTAPCRRPHRSTTTCNKSLEPGLENGVVLKGITRPKINGGYFGDITVDGADGNGHRYGFHGSLPFVLRS